MTPKSMKMIRRRPSLERAVVLAGCSVDAVTIVHSFVRELAIGEYGHSVAVTPIHSTL